MQKVIIQGPQQGVLVEVADPTPRDTRLNARNY